MYKNSVQRFKEIVRVLASYGFGYIVDSKSNRAKNSPINLTKAFEELGPTFIKIGQILSARPDILPPDYIKELSNLQDKVAPERYEDINSIFISEFNKPIEECFIYFEKEPLASASIAQVHNAILDDGREVIVKVQRPEIREKMHMDISILHKIIKLSKSKFANALIDPSEALDEILASTENELNFKIEAENINKFRDLNKNVAFCYAPFIIDRLSSSKVLTMEKINGLKITDIHSLDTYGYDSNDIGNKLTLSFFKQIFTDGFFHGDPHPGNLLIDKGKICFIDFGIVGTLSDSLKSSLNEAIVAVALKDIDKLVSVIISIGIKKGFVDRNKLYEDIEYLFFRYVSTSLNNIKISVLIEEIFDCAKNNNIKLPKDLTLLVKAMIIVEGVVAKIAPEIQIIDVAIPFVRTNSELLLLKNINLDQFLIHSYNFTKDLSLLPSKFTELTNSILKGRAKIQFEIPHLNKSINELNKMTNRLVFALIISSSIIGSSLILNKNIGPQIYGMSFIGILGFAIAALMGLWLLVSIIKSGKL